MPAPTSTRVDLVQSMIDVYDRGPRFRSHRYLVRLNSHDGSSRWELASYETEPEARFLCGRLQSLVLDWFIELADRTAGES